MLGSARTNATVTVNDTPTYRKGEYFRAEVEAANSAGALWLSLTNLAVLQNGSNPDIVTNTIGNLFVPKNPETFTYDVDGNQTSDGRWTNRWDAENRLIAVESLSTTPDGAKRKLVFAYDWQGRRTSKIVSNFVSGSWVLTSNARLVYDNWNLLAELNATNNAVINSYMWGLDLSDTEHGAGGVGGLIAIQSTGNGMHFYSFDGNGNVTTLTSSTNGAVTAEYEYDPFLNPLRATGPMASFNSFTGSGKFWDHETGSYYYGYRYLRDGRWLSRDPLEEIGGLNLQFFDHNDLINSVDQNGLSIAGKAYKWWVEKLKRTGKSRLLQVHHRIGQEIFDDPNFGPWLKKLGFEKDASANLMVLPTKKGKALLVAGQSSASKRVIHEGRHLNAYVEPIRFRVLEIQKLHQDGKIAACEARKLIIELQTEIKEALKGGKMKLNNAEMLKLADGAINLCGLAVIAVQPKDPRMEKWDEIELKVSAVEYVGKEGVLGMVGKVVDFFNPVSDAVLGARILDDFFAWLEKIISDPPWWVPGHN